MPNVNVYFDGKVKSIAVANSEGNYTVGVMDAGDYEFGTNTVECMTVLSGVLTVLLPGAQNWKDFGKGETFSVPAHAKFQLRVKEQTAYLCRYE